MMEARLEEAFAIVGRALSGSREPWWIIGSSALVLGGVVDLVPGDIDVLGSREGMIDLLQALGSDYGPSPGASARFRSDPYQRVRLPGLPDIEVMGGLNVMTQEGWAPVEPRTRVPVAVRDTTVFVPEPAEQGEILRLFGRDKDLAKARLVETFLRG